MNHARLHKPALQRKEEVARAKAHPSAVARSSRAARDPRFMRAVDHLQRTAWRQTSSGADAHLLQRAAASAGMNASPLSRTDIQCFSAVLDVQRLSYGDTGVPVSSPHDPAEKEAEAIAQQVATMPAEEGAEVDAQEGAEQGAPEYGSPPPRAPAYSPIARAGEGATHAPPALMNEIAAAGPLGRPLPTHVRRYMEPRFRADFRGVRVHTGEHAARLSSRLNAHAFTLGNQVFFGRNRFNPDTHAGRHLIAHELTHTIQQGGAVQQAPVQRAVAPAVSSTSEPQVQRGLFDFLPGIDTVLNALADLANNIPGWRMFTIVLGTNPINGQTVDRSAANILRAIVEFMPGGALITQALDKYGVFDKVGGWIEGQLASLGLSGAALKATLMDFIHSLDPTDFLHPGAVWDRAKATFTGPIERIITFVKSLAGKVLDFIKDAVLRPIADLAAQTPAWDLFTAVLGRNPITGDPVPRTAETLIGGFMKLIGQQEIWENMKKANAVARAFAWFQTAMAELMGFVNEIPGLFKAALASLEIADFIILPVAFVKVGKVFSGFAQRFITWAGGTIWNLLEIIFDSVKPGAMAYVKKTGAALKSILKNPIPFVGNLVKAAKLGFQNFGNNIGTHLKAALIDWLTGSLPGVYIPKSFALTELLKFVLSVLGLTWANIRSKLVKATSENVVKGLETTFNIVVALVRDGPAAAWEKIKEQLSNLKDMVVGAITDMVVDMVMKKAVPKLIAMFIPGAGFLSAIISIYETVMVFVEKISKIIQVVTAFIDSIVAIASGAIGAAANRVERILAGLLSLAISFLAGFAGLGRVADKVMEVLNKYVRNPIDKALDWLINWIVTTAKKLFARLFGKGDKKKDDKKDSSQVIGQVRTALQAKAHDVDSAAAFRTMIDGLVTTYGAQGLTAIRVQPAGPGRYRIEASASPFTFLEEVNVLTKSDYGYVVAALAIDDAIALPNVYNGAGDHAEEKIIPKVDSYLAQFKGSKKTMMPKKIELFVSQSPCKKRCAPPLLALKSKYPKIPTWVVYYKFLYQGTGGNQTKNSLEAIAMLKKGGFHVLQWDEVVTMIRQGKPVP